MRAFLKALFEPNISRLAAKKKITRLIKALSYQRNAGVRRDAAIALGNLGDARATTALGAALRDSEMAVRQTAADALSRVGDASCVEPLVGALDDPEPNVRQAAVRALHKRGDGRAIGPLAKKLRDRDLEVRQLSSTAIAALAERHRNKKDEEFSASVREALEDLIAGFDDSDTMVRGDLLKAMKAFGIGQFPDMSRRKVEAVTSLLSHGDVSVRRFAADALCEIGNELAAEPLARALKDSDAIVRQYAAEALAMRGDSRAIKPFVDIFSQLKYSQCEIRPQTFAALSNLSDKRVVSLLSEYLVAHCFKAESGTSVERHALSGRTWNQNLHMFTRGKTTGLGVDARLALVKLGSTYASFSGTTICLHANRMEVDGDGYCRDCDEILYRRYREPIRAKGAIGHDEMNVNTMSKSQWHQRMEAVFGAKHVIEQASLRG